MENFRQGSNNINNFTSIFPTQMKLDSIFQDRAAVTSPPQTSTFSYRSVNNDYHSMGESNAQS